MGQVINAQDPSDWMTLHFLKASVEGSKLSGDAISYRKEKALFSEWVDKLAKKAPIRVANRVKNRVVRAS